jgi:hypothetical protein
MNEKRPNPIVHVLPSLTDVAFLLPLIFMFARLGGGKALLSDADTGWHIKTGEWILANHRVPRNDLFSFTKPDAPWFAWEWLCDVFFGFMHQHWGLAGVVALGMLLLCTTSALLFRLIMRHCSNPMLGIGITFLAEAASTVHWHARPHLFTILLTVVFLHILDRSRDAGADPRILMALPVLTAVWTNLHGGFMTGLILLLLYTAGEMIAFALDADRENAKSHWRTGKLYGLTFAACALASLVNPFTFRLHLFIWTFLRQPFLNGISEWMSPGFHEAPYFESLLLMAAGVAMWSLTRRRYAEVLTIAAWAHLSLFAVRNVPMFVIVAAPVVARNLEEMMEALKTAPLAKWFQTLLGDIKDFGAEVAEIDNLWRVHAVSAVVFLAVAFTLTSGRLSPKYSADFDPEHFPVKAAEVFAARPGQPRVFTTDQWADFLIYRFYPKWRVFYDDRADLYGNTFFEDYGKITNATLNWQKYLDQYQVESVLIPVDLPLTGAMKESRLWRPVYDDHYAIIFDRVGVTPAAKRGNETASTPQETKFAWAK